MPRNKMEPRSFNLKPLERRSTLKENMVVSNDNYVEVKQALEKEAHLQKKESLIKGSQVIENIVD